MKDSTLLLLAGLGLAGFYLISKATAAPAPIGTGIPVGPGSLANVAAGYQSSAGMSKDPGDINNWSSVISGSISGLFGLANSAITNSAASSGSGSDGGLSDYSDDF